MILQKKTIERIAKDVKYLINNPLDNIYYKHDNENITKGYALIIGNVDTPYAYGNYLFEFTFPNNYPYEPPKLKFLTNDLTSVVASKNPANLNSKFESPTILLHTDFFAGKYSVVLVTLKVFV